MKINQDLLESLYKVNHPSRLEYPVINIILKWCYNWIPNLTIEFDGYSNLFITKNTNNPLLYPCIVAHMDEVVDLGNVQRKVTYANGIYRAEIEGTRKSCQLGADDSNGICIALQLLQNVPDLKVCFTTEEEIGAKGAIVAAENLDFFDNCMYLIQADRRGDSDVIEESNGIQIASEEFLKDISDIMLKYGYKRELGVFTDVGEIGPEVQLSAINVSCGYYGEHTINECCILSELENCLNFIYEIVTTLNKVYLAPPKQQYKNYSYYDSKQDTYDGYEYLKNSDYEKALYYGDEDYPFDSSVDNLESLPIYYENEWSRDVDDVAACKNCTTFDCLNCDITTKLCY